MPRAGLTELAVIEAAERLIDEVGPSQLTLVKLASSLGVRQPSLYKHIESTGGLVRSISIRTKRELAVVLARAAVGRERDGALLSVANAYRAWALEHPGRYATLQTLTAGEDPQDEAASLHLVEIITDILAGYALADEDAVDAARAVRAALHGFVLLEMGGSFGLPVDVDGSFRQMVEALTRALWSWPSAQIRDSGEAASRPPDDGGAGARRLSPKPNAGRSSGHGQTPPPEHARHRHTVP